MFKQLLGATLLALVLVGAGCTKTNTAEETNVQASQEAVITAFYARLQAEDYDGAKALVDPEIGETDRFKRAWNRVKEWTIVSVTIEKVRDTQVDIILTTKDGGKDDVEKDQIELIDRDGTWWIAEFPS